MFTPTVPEHGWSAAAHTVVEVVTDDMPFLVDSMTMALAEDGSHTVHVVIHPLFEVVRDVAGELRDVRGGDEGRQALTNDHESTGQVDQGGLETVQESWMHIEIDRVTDEDELAEIEARLQRVLRDNRDAVEDWPRMQAKLAEIVEELEAAPPTLPDPTELAPRHRRSCAGSATTTSRSSATGSTASSRTATSSRSARSRGPGWASCAATSCSPRRSRSCPRRCASAPRSRDCWCWPRPTPRPRCTGRPTSTTSG